MATSRERDTIDTDSEEDEKKVNIPMQDLRKRVERGEASNPDDSSANLLPVGDTSTDHTFCSSGKRWILATVIIVMAITAGVVLVHKLQNSKTSGGVVTPNLFGHPVDPSEAKNPKKDVIGGLIRVDVPPDKQNESDGTSEPTTPLGYHTTATDVLDSDGVTQEVGPPDAKTKPTDTPHMPLGEFLEELAEEDETDPDEVLDADENLKINFSQGKRPGSKGQAGSQTTPGPDVDDADNEEENQDFNPFFRFPGKDADQDPDETSHGDSESNRKFLPEDHQGDTNPDESSPGGQDLPSGTKRRLLSTDNDGDLNCARNRKENLCGEQPEDDVSSKEPAPKHGKNHKETSAQRRKLLQMEIGEGDNSDEEAKIAQPPAVHDNQHEIDKEEFPFFLWDSKDPEIQLFWTENPEHQVPENIKESDELRSKILWGGVTSTRIPEWLMSQDMVLHKWRKPRSTSTQSKDQTRLTKEEEAEIRDFLMGVTTTIPDPVKDHTYRNLEFYTRKIKDARNAARWDLNHYWKSHAPDLDHNLRMYNRALEEVFQGIFSRVPFIHGHNDLAWQYYMRVKNQVYSVDLDKDLRTQKNWMQGSNITDTHTDIPRLRKGMVGAQFWACFVLCNTSMKDAVRASLEQLDTIKKFVRRYSDDLQWVTTAQGIWDAFHAKKIGSLVGLEGGHSIDSSLAALRMFYDLGVRYMTLTHFCNTPWADMSGEDDDGDITNGTHGGLTPFGEKVVLEMNRLGMMVDLSHVSHQTMEDALRVTKAPIIFSHSSVYHLCEHHRNVRDDILQKTKENGGVVMVNFYSDYLACKEGQNKTVTINDVAEHMTYIRDKFGADIVGIGGDYDGVPRMPKGLEDVSFYPDLVRNLLKGGWSEADVEKAIGRNILRVFEKVEQVRDEMLSQPPYEDLIRAEDLPEGYKECRSDP